MANFQDFRVDLVRGDTKVVQFRVKQNALAVNISAWQKFWFTAKFNVQDPDGSAVMQLATGGGGITLADAVNGLLQITIQPANTSALAEQDYGLFADLQGKDPSGNIFTLARGVLAVAPEVTQATI